MSTTIDEKVVSMSFDNKNFETNVKTSMSTLDKLKKSLQFKGATKGLEEVSKAADKIDFKKTEMGATRAGFHIQDVFEKVTRYLENNIAKRIVNVFENTAKMFTIEPITTGFNEYELKMGSVQTIMAATGEDINTVNKYLQELNEYSDKTIYSFADMTQNIGKFTNAGVSLDDAVLAMKGISNEAALSGANANEASRAMYNLAQSLSMGYVQYIDWKSIENANMATVDFKRNLAEMAVQLGVVKKEGNDLYSVGGEAMNLQQLFKDGLKDQWLTTDVLIGTLREYADETTELGKRAYAAAQDVKTFTMMMDTLKEAAQSGWAMTWELIIGDFNQAKELFTQLAEYFGGAIDAMSDNRNAILMKAMYGPMDQLDKKIAEAGIDTADLVDRMKEISNRGAAIDNAIEKYGSLSQAMHAGAISSDLLKEALHSMNQEVIDLSDITEDLKKNDSGDQVLKAQKALKLLGYDLGEFGDQLDGLDGKYGPVTEAAVKLFQAEHNLAETGIIDEATLKALDEANNKTYELIEGTDELIDHITEKGGRELLWESLMNTLKGIAEVLGVVKKAWNDVFYPGMSEEEIIAFKAERIFNFINALNKLTQQFTLTNDEANKLRRTFKGLFALLHIITSIMHAGLRVAIEAVNVVLDMFGMSLLDATANIGDMLVYLDKLITSNNFLYESIKFVVKNIVRAIVLVKELVQALLEIPAVQNGIERVKDGIKSVFGVVGDYFIGGIAVITDFIHYCNELDGVSLDNLKLAFKKFRTDVVGYFFDFDKMFDLFKKGFNSVTSFFNDKFSVNIKGFDKFKAAVGKVIDKIKDMLSGVSFSSIASILMGSGLIWFVKKFTDVVGLFSEGINSILKGVGSLIKSISGIGKAISTTLRANALVKVALAIGILAGSLWLLAKIDSASLWEAVAVLGAIAGVLVALTLAIGLMGKASPEGMKALTTSMAAIGISMFALVAAMKILGTLSPEEMVKGLATITIFGLIVSKMVSSMANTDKTGKYVGKMIMKFAASFIILALAMKLLGKLTIGEMTKGLTVITIFGLIVKSLIKTTADNGVFADGVAKMIAKFTIGFILLGAAIKILGNLSMEEITKGGLIILAFTAIIRSLSKITGDNGKYAGQIGKMMAGLSIAFLMLGVAMKFLGNLSLSEMVKGLACIAVFGLITKALAEVCGNANEDSRKIGSMMIGVSVAFLLMAAAMKSLSKLTLKEIAHGALAMAAIGVLLTGIIIASKQAKGAQRAVTQIAIVIGVTAIALGALSAINPDKLLPAAIALGAVMTALGVAMRGMSSMGNTKITKAIPQLAAMAAIMFAIGFVFEQMSTLDDPASAVVLATSMGELVLALAGACLIISKSSSSFKMNANTAGLMGSVTLMVTAIAGILALVQGISVDIGAIAALTTMLYGMVGAIAILGKLGALTVPPITSILALEGEIITIVAVIIAIQAALQGLEGLGLDTSLASLASFCTGIGEAIGGFVGGLIGSAVGELASALPTIATNIGEFARIMDEDVFTHMDNINDTAITKFGDMAGALLKFTGAELLQGLADFADAEFDPEQTKEDLVGLADAMIAFGNEIEDSGVDEASIAKATNLGNLFATLQNSLPRTGGWLQEIIGEKDLSKFGESVESFCQSMKIANDLLTGVEFDTETITTAVDMGKLFAALQEAIPKTGLFQDLMGTHDFDQFSNSIDIYTQSIKLVNELLTGVEFNEGVIETATNLGYKFTDLMESIPKTGLMQSIFGEHDFDGFAKGIGEYATGIASFADAVNTRLIDEGEAIKAVNIGTAIAHMVEEIPEEGFLDFFTGTHDFEGFSEQLPLFGEGIGSFCDSISGVNIDPNAADKAIQCAEAFCKWASGDSLPYLDFLIKDDGTWELMSSNMKMLGEALASFSEAAAMNDNADVDKLLELVKTIGSLSALVSITDTTTVADFADDLDKLATGMKNFAMVASGIDSGDLAIAVNQVKTIVGSIQSMTKEAIDDITMSFDDPDDTIGTSMGDLMTKALQKVIDAGPDFATEGKNLVDNLSKGFNDGGGITTTVANSISSALTSLRYYYSSFKSAGSYLVDGFVAGIKDNTYKASKAAADLGNAASTATAAALDEHSPSKVMYKIGNFAGLGFVNALYDSGKAAHDAAEDMALEARTGLDTAVSRIRSSFTDGFGDDLTIRPILDLSDVESKAGKISGLLNNGNSKVGLTANVGSITANMNSRQNGKDPVVSAIDALGTKVASTNGNVYNVNGITYDDGSNISEAVRMLIRATRVEGRV